MEEHSIKIPSVVDCVIGVASVFFQKGIIRTNKILSIVFRI